MSVRLVILSDAQDLRIRCIRISRSFAVSRGSEAVREMVEDRHSCLSGAYGVMMDRQECLSSTCLMMTVDTQFQEAVVSRPPRARKRARARVRGLGPSFPSAVNDDR